MILGGCFGIRPDWRASWQDEFASRAANPVSAFCSSEPSARYKQNYSWATPLLLSQLYASQMYMTVAAPS